MQATTILLLCATACALVLIGWLALQIHRQQLRIQQRMDLLDRQVGSPPVVASLSAPVFELAALDGSRVTRDSLLARGKPVMLVTTDPRCGPCYELLPDIGGWQRVYGDRLTVALVSAGAPDRNRAMISGYGIDPGLVLVQESKEFQETYGLEMAPAGVLVNLDGHRLGEAALGAYEVRELVANALGLAVPAPPERSVEPVKRGQPAPRLRRPDLDGNPIDLTTYRGRELMLLFWSPGCSHCESLLPEIKAWETRQSATRMLVVTRGSVDLNKDVGLRTRMIPDDDRSIADLFGVAGTPAAVVIDRNGIVATNVARGEKAVRTLGDRLLGPAAMTPDPNHGQTTGNPVASGNTQPGPA